MKRSVCLFLLPDFVLCLTAAAASHGLIVFVCSGVSRRNGRLCSRTGNPSEGLWLRLTFLPFASPNSPLFAQIWAETRCPASAGVSNSMLVARLATKQAKPNGCVYVAPDKVLEFVSGLKVEELPGVGYHLNDKLKQKGITSVPELRAVSLSALQTEFGSKTGEMLFNYSRGSDVRGLQLERVRRSVGVEVNWGVRFDDDTLVEFTSFLLACLLACASFACNRSHVCSRIPIRFPVS
jgi:hypothetical protein